MIVCCSTSISILIRRCGYGFVYDHSLVVTAMFLKHEKRKTHYMKETDVTGYGKVDVLVKLPGMQQCDIYHMI